MIYPDAGRIQNNYRVPLKRYTIADVLCLVFRNLTEKTVPNVSSIQIINSHSVTYFILIV
ncbi:MAG TPA: hypothetical protein PK209_07620 [Saprospiraceae bacterium]|nr:hypothetical protein [Saprospiraceae bacterium]